MNGYSYYVSEIANNATSQVAQQVKDLILDTDSLAVIDTSNDLNPFALLTSLQNISISGKNPYFKVDAENDELETRTTQETEHLKMQKKALKAQLKRGEIDNVSYQRSITPMNKRIEELKFQLFRFRRDKLNEMFHTNEIYLGTIKRYFREKDKQSQQEN